MSLLRYHLRARQLLVALVAVLPAIGLIVYPISILFAKPRISVKSIRPLDGMQLVHW